MMVDSPSCFLIKLKILLKAFFFSITIKFRFSRLKLEINVCGLTKFNCFNISYLTFKVAVAVKAMRGVLGNISFKSFKFR